MQVIPESCPLKKEVEIVRGVHGGEGEEEEVIVVPETDAEPSQDRRD